MRFERKLKCKKCGRRESKQWAYKFWHVVHCFEYFENTDITWVKTWWLCQSCAPEASTWRARFHDIDGHTYSLSLRPPFLRRS